MAPRRRVSLHFPSHCFNMVLAEVWENIALGLGIFVRSLFPKSPHCRLCEELLFGGFRVSRHLFKSGVTCDSRDLIGGTSRFSKSAGSSLPQTVRNAALRKSRSRNPRRHVVAEALGRERLAKARRQHDEVRFGPRFKNASEFEMQRKRKLRPCFALHHSDRSVLDIPPRHCLHIGGALPGVEQKREGSTLTTSYRPMTS